MTYFRRLCLNIEFIQWVNYIPDRHRHTRHGSQLVGTSAVVTRSTVCW